MGISTVFGGNIYSFVTLSSRKRKHAFLRSISLFFFIQQIKRVLLFHLEKWKNQFGEPQLNRPRCQVRKSFYQLLSVFRLVPPVKIHLILTIISIISDFVILNYLNKNDVTLTLFLFKCHRLR